MFQSKLLLKLILIFSLFSPAGETTAQEMQVILNTPERVLELIRGRVSGEVSEITDTCGAKISYYTGAAFPGTRFYSAAGAGAGVNSGLVLGLKQHAASLPRELTGFAERLLASMLLEDPALLSAYMTERMVKVYFNGQEIFPGFASLIPAGFLSSALELSAESVNRDPKGYGKVFKLTLSDTASNRLIIIFPGNYNLIHGNEKPELDKKLFSALEFIAAADSLQTLSPAGTYNRDDLIPDSTGSFLVTPPVPFIEGFSSSVTASAKDSVPLLTDEFPHETLKNIMLADIPPTGGDNITLQIRHVQYQQKVHEISINFRKFRNWYLNNFIPFAAVENDGSGSYEITLLLADKSLTGFHMLYFRAAPSDFLSGKEFTATVNLYGNIRADNLSDLTAAGEGAGEKFKVLIK